MSQPHSRFSYKPVGETLKKFHESPDFVRVLIGPLGSGKTQACISDMLSRIDNQEPDVNGKRRSRWVVARNTQPDLFTTTIKDFREITDQFEIGVFTLGTPPTWRGEYVKSADGTIVEFEVIFLAFDHPEDSKKARGLQLSGVWFNEMKELSRANIDMLTSRVGRFPPRAQCPSAWNGVIGDSNAPDRDLWLVKLALDVKPESWWFGIQPPGVTKIGGQWKAIDTAENAQNLPVGYYQRLLAGRPDPWIRQNLANEFVFYADGRPVHQHFSESLHVMTLQATPAIPLVVGIDFGRTPAAVITQRQHNGAIYVLSELTSENMGAKEFGKLLKAHLNDNYPNFKIHVYGDPAGNAMSQTSDVTPFMMLEASGIFGEPAPTNDFEERVTAVDDLLMRLTDGLPALLVHDDNRMLIKGLAGAYMFKRVQVSGEDRYRDEPVKSPESHVCEALQYACLGMGLGQSMFTQEFEEDYGDIERWRPDPKMFE